MSLTFYTADFPSGISLEKISEIVSMSDYQILKEIFYQYFEDPQNELPYDKENEWGYLWIHGGPYFTDEGVSDLFGSEIDEQIIRQLIDELNNECAVWSPVPNEEENPEIEDENEIKSPLLAHQELLDAAVKVQSKVAEIRKIPPGVGHNNPPPEGEEFKSPLSQDELDDVISATEELENTPPEPRFFPKAAENAISILRSLFIKLGEYTDSFSLAAANSAGKILGPVVGLAALDLWFDLRNNLGNLIAAGTEWINLIRMTF